MSKWVKCEERQPSKYGRYQVIRRVRSGKHEQDEYLWCGSYWVTHGGGPSKAVEEWLDEEADEG